MTFNNPVSIKAQAFVALAREIGRDIFPLEQLLSVLHISPEEYSRLKDNKDFQALVASEREAWNSASNTQERVKIKAASMIEDWLPDLYAKIVNDPSLSNQLEAAKVLARFAGIGNNTGADGPSGSGIAININLGEDRNLKFEKELPPKVIDVTPAEGHKDGDTTPI